MEANSDRSFYFKHMAGEHREAKESPAELSLNRIVKEKDHLIIINSLSRMPVKYVECARHPYK
jgi:hypothetical protein